MTNKEVFLKTVSALKEAGKEGPVREAEMLVCRAMGKERVALYAGARDEFSAQAQAALDEMLRRRLAGEPLQYIFGETEFMGHIVYVDERVLIPRPETELLADLVIRQLRLYEDPEYLDICTGSGCIPLAVSKAIPEIKACVSDISPAALEVARRNLGEDFRLIESDLFENIEGKYDVITANPPYIAEKDIKTLQTEVKDYEPLSALNGGEAGTEIPERILWDAPLFLKDGGALFMEIGDDQANYLKSVAVSAGFTQIRILKDFHDRDRILAAKCRK